MGLAAAIAANPRRLLNIMLDVEELKGTEWEVSRQAQLSPVQRETVKMKLACSIILKKMTLTEENRSFLYYSFTSCDPSGPWGRRLG